MTKLSSYLCQVKVNNMKIQESQKQVLKIIQKKLMWGDISKIAAVTNKSKQYVSTVLSISTDNYDEAIISAAIRVIEKRDQTTKKNLQKLQAA